jgi:hypothetical protein
MRFCGARIPAAAFLPFFRISENMKHLRVVVQLEIASFLESKKDFSRSLS